MSVRGCSLEGALRKEGLDKTFSVIANAYLRMKLLKAQNLGIKLHFTKDELKQNAKAEWKSLQEMALNIEQERARASGKDKDPRTRYGELMTGAVRLFEKKHD